ncbi:MAG: YheU family protein [Geobacteraceae bacterium]
MSEEAIIDIPLDRINPDTLRKMVEEFVTREWSEPADSEYTMDEKVDQVMQQLEQNQAKIVYDSTSETCNIISCR